MWNLHECIIRRQRHAVSPHSFLWPGAPQPFCTPHDKQTDTIHLICLCKLTLWGAFWKDWSLILAFLNRVLVFGSKNGESGDSCSPSEWSFQSECERCCTGALSHWTITPLRLRDEAITFFMKFLSFLTFMSGYELLVFWSDIIDARLYKNTQFETGKLFSLVIFYCFFCQEL